MATRLYVFSSNVDVEKASLAAEGFANGSINDCQFAYLGSLGFTGGLNDRILDYILNPPSSAGAFSSAFSSAFAI